MEENKWLKKLEELKIMPYEEMDRDECYYRYWCCGDWECEYYPICKKRSKEQCQE